MTMIMMRMIIMIAVIMNLEQTKPYFQYNNWKTIGCRYCSENRRVLKLMPQNDKEGQMAGRG